MVFTVTCFVYSPLIICCGKTCVKNERHAIRKERSIFCQYVIGCNCPPVSASWARSVAKWNDDGAASIVSCQLPASLQQRRPQQYRHNMRIVIWTEVFSPESRKFIPPYASQHLIYSIIETQRRTDARHWH